jgi:L-asparaginase
MFNNWGHCCFRQKKGKLMQPKIIIHGGAGNLEGQVVPPVEFQKDLLAVVEQTYALLCEHDARSAVLHAIRLMESNPVFNAGTGSRLQRDGKIRMSAAIMSSKDNRFSGVINIRNVEHPIDIADRLANEKYTVLGGTEATEYARSKNFPYFNTLTEVRWEEYKKELIGNSGTVGAVALDREGTICVGTSTGGIGYELPGRIGDSATVAGTYASHYAGVSCTGRGEHIINQAVAARIVSRVEDGMPLKQSVDKLIEEANQFHYRFGLIALDVKGEMIVGQTENVEVMYAYHDGQAIRVFRQ